MQMNFMSNYYIIYKNLEIPFETCRYFLGFKVKIVLNLFLSNYSGQEIVIRSMELKLIENTLIQVTTMGTMGYDDINF